MAITKELLDANSQLSSLTDEQKKAIATLSVNDEQTTINARIGELHGQYDSDIFEVTGLKKNDGEKSYAFNKRILAHYKKVADETATKLTALEAERKELETKLKASAADEVVVSKLKDAEQTIEQLKASLVAEQTEKSQAEKKYTNDMKVLKAQFEFEKASSGIKFKHGLPESVTSTLLSVTINDLLANYTPDFIEKQDGKQMLVFRDKNGEIVKNTAKLSEPFTAEDLIKASPSMKDVIDTGRQQSGAGSNNPKPNQSSVDVDLSMAKSQVEADEVISNYLLKLGVVKGTVDFKEQQAKIRTDHKVENLPIK